MRGFFATITLIVAIGGMLIVIGYGASRAYLNFRDDEADLYNSMLMGSIAPAGWSAVETPGVSFREEFITPCLQTPLLEGVGFKGRGAAEYRTGNAGDGAIHALLMQTSESNARAVMADVERDTDSNCERGVTVGTVESATVDMLEAPKVDQGIVVTTTRQGSDGTQRQSSVLFRDGEYLALVQQESSAADASREPALTDLATSLADQVADPPTTAELEAAGVVDEPTIAEEAADRTRTETSNLLTAFGRIPVEAGLGALGGAVLLFYLLGARLSRTPENLPAGNPPNSSSSASPTLDDYGAPDRHSTGVYSTSAAVNEQPISQSSEDEPEPDTDSDTSNGHREEEVAEPPPPILDFPQKPIDEKLKILKEARLKAPKREHRAMREIEPEVNWTDEISKEEPPQKDSAPAPQSGQVSRKALLKKLRANQSESG